MPFSLGDIAEQRQNDIQEAVKASQNSRTSMEALSLLLSGLEQVREAVASVAVESVTVNNFDEVRAALRNELNRISKPIIKAVNELALSNSQKERAIASIEQENSNAIDETHDIQIVKRPKTRFIIDNIRDAQTAFPDSFSVNNLGDLQAQFDALSKVIKDTFNITIPTPQVTVTPPDINLPESPSNSINFAPLLEALDPLKFLSDRPNKPISVRFSDGVNFLKAFKTIVQNQEKQATAFSQGLTESGATKAFKKVSQGNIGGSGALELTDAATAVVISATSVPCKWVDICSNGGTAQIGTSAAVQTVGAEVGVTLFVGQPYRVNTDNLNKVYAAGATNTRISWTYYV